MASDNLSDIIREMSGQTSERFDRERQQAQKAAREERVDEQAEVAKRVAVATLNEKDNRERHWCYSNLGSLSDQELRKLIRQEHGFEPI